MDNNKEEDGITRTQEIMIAITPIPFGILSFVASAAIVWMIYKSPTQFGNPFRRIFFGMCLYDLFQSVGSITSSFVTPADSNGDVWGAMGNQGTCVAQGFFVQVSIEGCPISN